MALTKEKLIERWEQVARVLEELPPHAKRRHFDMGTFGMETDCGTIACAAGHCSLDPWFRRRGFSAQLVGDKGDRDLEPTKGRTWSHMVERFFGVPDEAPSMYDDDEWPRYELLTDGVNIFYDGRSRPVTVVVKEIRAYIQRLRKELPDKRITRNP